MHNLPRSDTRKERKLHRVVVDNEKGYFCVPSRCVTSEFANLPGLGINSVDKLIYYTDNTYAEIQKLCRPIPVFR
jgi:hypothetical protein